MKRIIFLITLLLAFTQVQAQYVKVHKVKQVQRTEVYDEEVENPPYVQALKFVKEYEEGDLALINAIIEVKKMTSTTDLVEANFQSILQFLKEHQLQVGGKRIDEKVDLDKVSKSDIKKQVRRYGSIQIVNWDKSTSSITPIKDKYETYLENKELVKNAKDESSYNQTDYKDYNGKRIVTKRKTISVTSPEFTVDYIIGSKTDSIPLKEIKNAKEYYGEGDFENQSTVVVYNASDQKYVTPEYEKAKKFYHRGLPYLLFEYEGKKYAIVTWELKQAKEENAILDNLPKKYGYYESEDIKSDVFEINLIPNDRKNIFAEKGIELPAMLNDIEQGAKQIIIIYNQMDKYNTQLQDYQKKISLYGKSAASKYKDPLLSVLDQVEKLNNEVKKIRDDLDRKYNLGLSEKFYVFVKKGRYNDPDKLTKAFNELRYFLSYL